MQTVEKCQKKEKRKPDVTGEEMGETREADKGARGREGGCL